MEDSMDNMDKLIEFFRKFPGTGPRQARRFVYFLLNQNQESRETLAKLISSIKNTIHQCKDCYRFFAIDSGTRVPNAEKLTCNICANKNRDHRTLMIVANDADLETIERSRSYDGVYFVLGGLIPILEKEPEKRIRVGELFSRPGLSDLDEIIIALSATTEGDYTEDYIRNHIKNVAKNIKISTFGKGISTGLELEYSDSETIRNALRGRR